MRGVSEARFGSLVARGVRAVSHDAGRPTSGFWVVVVTFEGTSRPCGWTRCGAARMPDVLGARWRRRARGRVLAGAWRTSLGRSAYLEGVAEVRRRIAAGTVYQVNLCRVMEHDLPEDAAIAALGARLAAGNPAPYAATIDLPAAGSRSRAPRPRPTWCARGDRVDVPTDQGHGADGRRAPGQGPRRERDDRRPRAQRPRARSAVPGHGARSTTSARGRGAPRPGPPGLRRLGRAATRARRGRDLLDATFPPGSVTGAPKLGGARAIAGLEPVPRGPYCGAVGWVDADRDEARARRRHPHVLGRASGELRFGTGARHHLGSATRRGSGPRPSSRRRGCSRVATGGLRDAGCRRMSDSRRVWVDGTARRRRPRPR